MKILTEAITEVTTEILVKAQFDYIKLVNTGFRFFQMFNAAFA